MTRIISIREIIQLAAILDTIQQITKITITREPAIRRKIAQITEITAITHVVKGGRKDTKIIGITDRIVIKDNRDNTNNSSSCSYLSPYMRVHNNNSGNAKKKWR